jgi:hypothetical protein
MRWIAEESKNSWSSMLPSVVLIDEEDGRVSDEKEKIPV